MHHRQGNLSSETLLVDDCWTTIIIFTLRNPHLLESGQGTQNGSTSPDGVLSLWWSDHLDLHCGRSQGRQFLGHALTDASKHGGSTGKNDIAVEVLADVNVTFHDGLEGCVVNSAGFLAHKAWLEQHFRAAEALAANC